MAVETFYRPRTDAPERPAFVPQELTKTQRDVLQFRVFGIDAETAAKALAISPHTVHTRIRKVRERMQANSLIEASLRAVRYGLVDPPKITLDDYAAVFSLSPAERRVGRQLIEAEGKNSSDAEIASALDISPHTVSIYLARLHRKLNTTDRVHAAVILQETLKEETADER